MFSAKSRLAFGLTSTVISVVLIGLNIGIMPDYRNVAMNGRAQLCEAIAANSSVVVRQRDLRRLQSVLDLVVERNDDILSAAVRREDGSLVVTAGDHELNWKPLEDSPSTDTQVTVPIRANNEIWGSVELCFTPLSPPGVWGYFTSPRTMLVAFIGAVTFLLCSIYLGKSLQHLDPSKVVPGRVRSALDTLAEGLLVLDHHQRIMLANQSFAEIVGESPEKLLGRQRFGVTMDLSQSVREQRVSVGMRVSRRGTTGRCDALPDGPRRQESLIHGQLHTDPRHRREESRCACQL